MKSKVRGGWRDETRNIDATAFIIYYFNKELHFLLPHDLESDTQTIVLLTIDMAKYKGGF